MDLITLKSSPELAKIIKRVLPSYRKHKILIHRASDVTLSNGWRDSGSKSDYLVWDGSCTYKPKYPTSPPQFNGGEWPPTIPIPAEGAIIKYGTSSGRTATATIYLPKE